MAHVSVAELVPAESYRRELLGYCYRYFGSYAEAEDAVQETLLRAWQNTDDFRGVSSLRTWLYRIATNICLDMRRAPQRRALPVDLHAAGSVPQDASSLTTRASETWVGPIADAWLQPGPDAADPADLTVARDSVRLAFVAALQLLPPRQRVVLVLRDVLAFSAQECADLLDLTVASVNSALARARRTLAARAPDAGAAAVSDRRDDDRRDEDRRDEDELCHRYVTAFEAYDVSALVRLLAEDAVFSMPPYELWLAGTTDIEAWWRGPGQVCRGSRTRVTRANGRPAVAVYHPVAPSRWEPFALHVLEARDGRISGLTHFMGAAVFAEFGLPKELTETG